MSNYNECVEINKAALARERAELNDHWDVECKKAAASGRFPGGVRLELANPPPAEHVEKWSDAKYEAYVSHFKGLEADYRHHDDAVPECWVVHLRERQVTPDPGQLPVPRDGPLTSSFKSFFRWPLFRSSK